MSDINPLTGQGLGAAPGVQRESAPRVSFEDPVSQKLDQIVHSDEAAEFAKLARAASKTKFATGNLEVDIRNYMKMKKIGQLITGMIEDDES